MSKVSFTGWVPADWPDEQIVRFAEDGIYPERPKVFNPYCDKYHIEVVVFRSKEVASYAAGGSSGGPIRQVHVDITAGPGTGRVRALRPKPSKVVIVGWVNASRKMKNIIHYTAWDNHHAEFGTYMKNEIDGSAEKVRFEIILTNI